MQDFLGHRDGQSFSSQLPSARGLAAAAATPMPAQYFFSKVLHLRHTVVESEKALLDTHEQAVEEELETNCRAKLSFTPSTRQKVPWVRTT